MAQTTTRGLWGSKLGFVLAASGSAIGLGNIVFFGANAYRFGGGAFYVPYLVALLAIGLPMMIVEFGLGKTQGSAFPIALGRVAGRKGEFMGWWSLMNSIFIGMYYITILAWSGSMMLESLGPLYAQGADSVGPTLNGVLESWMPAGLAVVIWLLNLLFLSKGTKTIGAVVKVFVPLMWVFMIGLVVRALTLERGFDGVWYLFNPDWDGIRSPKVWQGAFSQMFFSLSLGLGTMTAYASYLPRNSDVVNNASMVSFLNCSFEYIAGLAIFAILFTFSLQPSTGTLSMTLFIIPTGIAQFPAAQASIAFLFFLLLLIAGLTSSISIIESPVSALCDKFGWSRRQSLLLIAAIGLPGSLLFSLPMLQDLQAGGSQPLGISFLELIDHWAFGYSLLLVGLVEALFVGWIWGVDELAARINEHARVKLGALFAVFVKFVIPLLLGGALLFNVLDELGIGVAALGIDGRGLYQGDSGPLVGLGWLPATCFLFWLVTTVGFAAFLTTRPGIRTEEER